MVHKERERESFIRQMRKKMGSERERENGDFAEMRETGEK